MSQLESIQRRAARWVCGSRWISVNRSWTKSSDSCLQELHWSPLHTRRSYFSISLTHDILHNRVAIQFSRYFQFSTTITRSHPMTLCIPSLTTRQMLTASRGEPENACTCTINIIQSIFDHYSRAFMLVNKTCVVSYCCVCF